MARGSANNVTETRTRAKKGVPNKECDENKTSDSATKMTKTSGRKNANNEKRGSNKKSDKLESGNLEEENTEETSNDSVETKSDTEKIEKNETVSRNSRAGSLKSDAKTGRKRKVEKADDEVEEIFDEAENFSEETSSAKEPNIKKVKAETSGDKSGSSRVTRSGPETKTSQVDDKSKTVETRLRKTRNARKVEENIKESEQKDNDQELEQDEAKDIYTVVSENEVEEGIDNVKSVEANKVVEKSEESKNTTVGRITRKMRNTKKVEENIKETELKAEGQEFSQNNAKDIEADISENEIEEEMDKCNNEEANEMDEGEKSGEKKNVTVGRKNKNVIARKTRNAKKIEESSIDESEQIDDLAESAKKDNAQKATSSSSIKIEEETDDIKSEEVAKVAKKGPVKKNATKLDKTTTIETSSRRTRNTKKSEASNVEAVSGQNDDDKDLLEKDNEELSVNSEIEEEMNGGKSEEDSKDIKKNTGSKITKTNEKKNVEVRLRRTRNARKVEDNNVEISEQNDEDKELLEKDSEELSVHSEIDEEMDGGKSEENSKETKKITGSKITKTNEKKNVEVCLRRTRNARKVKDTNMEISEQNDEDKELTEKDSEELSVNSEIEEEMDGGKSEEDSKETKKNTGSKITKTNEKKNVEVCLRRTRNTKKVEDNSMEIGEQNTEDKELLKKDSEELSVNSEIEEEMDCGKSEDDSTEIKKISGSKLTKTNEKKNLEICLRRTRNTRKVEDDNIKVSGQNDIQELEMKDSEDLDGESQKNEVDNIIVIVNSEESNDEPEKGTETKKTKKVEASVRKTKIAKKVEDNIAVEESDEKDNDGDGTSSKIETEKQGQKAETSSCKTRNAKIVEDCNNDTEKEELNMDSANVNSFEAKSEVDETETSLRKTRTTKCNKNIIPDKNTESEDLQDKDYEEEEDIIEIEENENSSDSLTEREGIQKSAKSKINTRTISTRKTRSSEREKTKLRSGTNATKTEVDFAESDDGMQISVLNNEDMMDLDEPKEDSNDKVNESKCGETENNIENTKNSEQIENKSEIHALGFKNVVGSFEELSEKSMHISESIKGEGVLGEKKLDLNEAKQNSNKNNSNFQKTEEPASDCNKIENELLENSQTVVTVVQSANECKESLQVTDQKLKKANLENKSEMKKESSEGKEKPGDDDDDEKNSSNEIKELTVIFDKYPEIEKAETTFKTKESTLVENVESEKKQIDMDQVHAEESFETSTEFENNERNVVYENKSSKGVLEINTEIEIKNLKECEIDAPESSENMLEYVTVEKSQNISDNTDSKHSNTDTMDMDVHELVSMKEVKSSINIPQQSTSTKNITAIERPEECTDATGIEISENESGHNLLESVLVQKSENAMDCINFECPDKTTKSIEIAKCEEVKILKNELIQEFENVSGSDDENLNALKDSKEIKGGNFKTMNESRSSENDNLETVTDLKNIKDTPNIKEVKSNAESGIDDRSSSIQCNKVTEDESSSKAQDDFEIVGGTNKNDNADVSLKSDFGIDAVADNSEKDKDSIEEKSSTNTENKSSIEEIPEDFVDSGMMSGTEESRTNSNVDTGSSVTEDFDRNAEMESTVRDISEDTDSDMTKKDISSDIFDTDGTSGDIFQDIYDSDTSTGDISKDVDIHKAREPFVEISTEPRTDNTEKCKSSIIKKSEKKPEVESAVKESSEDILHSNTVHETSSKVTMEHRTDSSEKNEISLIEKPESNSDIESGLRQISDDIVEGDEGNEATNQVCNDQKTNKNNVQTLNDISIETQKSDKFEERKEINTLNQDAATLERNGIDEHLNITKVISDSKAGTLGSSTNSVEIQNKEEKSKVSKFGQDPKPLTEVINSDLFGSEKRFYDNSIKEQDTTREEFSMKNEDFLEKGKEQVTKEKEQISESSGFLKENVIVSDTIAQGSEVKSFENKQLIVLNSSHLGNFCENTSKMESSKKKTSSNCVQKEGEASKIDVEVKDSERRELSQKMTATGKVETKLDGDRKSMKRTHEENISEGTETELSLENKIKRKRVEETRLNENIPSSSEHGTITTNLVTNAAKPNVPKCDESNSEMKSRVNDYSEAGPSGTNSEIKRGTKKRKRETDSTSNETERQRIESASTPIRRYLEQFVPFLLEGLLKITYVRPADPIQYLADWMQDNKTAAYSRMNNNKFSGKD